MPRDDLHIFHNHDNGEVSIERVLMAGKGTITLPSGTVLQCNNFEVREVSEADIVSRVAVLQGVTRTTWPTKDGE